MDEEDQICHFDALLHSSLQPLDISQVPGFSVTSSKFEEKDDNVTTYSLSFPSPIPLKNH